jgi:alpha-tubulin suppressor-like RCC1 family protein
MQTILQTIEMYAMKARNIINRHHRYGWVLTLFAVVLVLGVYFRQDAINAAPAIFTQNNWTGGITANPATHSSHQVGWTEYSASTNLSGGASLSLGGEFFEDDFATSTTSVNPVLGGGFSGGTFTNATTSMGRVKLAPTTPSAVKVFSGNHSRSAYILKSDGTVWAWGYNNTKQLGDLTTTNRSTPIQVPISNVKDLAIHGYSTSNGTYTVVALKNDGTVWVWGEGQFCCGPISGEISQIVGLSEVVDIAAGDLTAFALKSDGTLYSWGSNNFGTRGDGTTAGGQNSTTLTQVHGVGDVGYLTDVIDVASAGFRGYALKSDGTVYVWGCFNLFVSCTGHRVPEQISGLTDVVAINAAGNGDGNFGNNFYAIRADGAVWTDTYVNSQYYATQTMEHVQGLTGIAEISSGATFVMARDHNGNVWTYGANTYGQLGDGTDTSSSGDITSGTFTQVPGLSSIESVAAGWETSYAVRDDGTIYAWGRNQYGQIGDSTATDRWSPVVVQWYEPSSLVGITTGAPHIISGGYASAYGIKSDGTLASWGYNGSGELGNGDSVNSSTAVPVSGLSGVLGVSSGSSGGYAVLSTGTVYAWGVNGEGQFGDGTTNNSSTPVQVPGITDAIAVSGGSATGYALVDDGVNPATVWAWGRGSDGQLGNGGNASSLTPVQVSGLVDPIAISSGANFSVALEADGTVWVWGTGTYGEMGDGSGVSSNIPVQASGLTGIIAIAAGANHAYALKDDGTVWAWGYNGEGQLGDGTYSMSYTPVQVSGLTGITVIGSGDLTGYAVGAGGVVYAWGHNGAGQLGDGTSAPGVNDSNVPVQVSGLTNIIAVTGGNISGYAVQSDGAVWSWGSNQYGQLGDGTTTNSSTPVQVIELSATAADFSAGSTPYALTGTFESAVIDFTAPTEFTTFSYRKFPEEINNSPYMRVRAGNNPDTNDVSWTDWSDPLVSGDDISAFSNNQYIQYKAEFNNEFFSDLLDVTIGYATVYPASGDLTSSVYNTEDQTNHISSLAWTETGTTTEETIKFQVRTSPDGITWSDWCGMDDTGYTCAGTNYFTHEHNGVDIGITNPIRSGGNDQYFQYKVFLTSGGTATPTLSEINIHYFNNVAPDFDTSYGDGTGITVTQEPTGEVTITYKVQDVDTLSASTTPGFITPSFAYSINGGSTWGAVPPEDMTVSSTANKAVGETAYITHTATWYATSSAPSVDVANALIAVTANDNEAAHNTTTATSQEFSLDTTGPVVSALTAPTGGRTTTSAQITFTTNETAVGYVEYSTQTEDDYHNISSPTASGTSHDITLSGLPTDTVYVYRAYAVDAFGNIGSPTLGGTFTVGTPSLLSFTDDGATSTTSNLAVTGGDFDLGSYSSTEVVGSGIGASLSLTGSGGAYTPKVIGGMLGGSGYAIKDDGTVWAWGRNNYGQLGDGTTTNSSTPVQVTDPLDDSGFLTDVVDIAASGLEEIFANTGSAYALKGDGSVWAWGNNTYGQLGDGTNDNSSVPVQVVGLSNITSISAGIAHGIALKGGVAPEVWAWGYNDSGQLGDGTTTSSNVPVQVNGLAGIITAVAANYFTSYILDSSGDVYAWGWNQLGQMGDGTASGTAVTAPTQSSVSNITEIATGGAHILALDTDGNVWSWGYGQYGQLGNGSTAAAAPTPAMIADLTDVIHVYGGAFHSLALKSNGEVWGWGANQVGELGGSIPNEQTTPALFTEFTDVGSLSAGYQTSLVFHTDGSLYAVGAAGFGQLGDGTTTDSSTPVQVGGPSFNLGGNLVYSASGTFTSNIINLAQDAEFTTLNYNTTLSGQTIAVDVRAGTTPTYNASTWTDWLTDIASGGDISGLTTTSPKQYFQYRVNYTGDTTASPSFNQLTVFYTQYTQDVGPGEEIPPAPTPSTGTNTGTVTPEGQPRNPAPESTPAPITETAPTPAPESTPAPVLPPTTITDLPPEVIATLPPFFQEIMEEQKAEDEAQYAAENPVETFFTGLFGGDKETPRSSSGENVPTFTTFVTDSVVKGITTITDLPPVRTTLDATTRVIEDPVGAIVTKVAATAGVVSGTAIAATSLFLNPLALAELFLVPARLMGIILSALGIRKRTRRWGTVYDSVTKQPLDPAYVVLKDKDGNEVGTGITDLDGRYGFLIGPGTYTIVANKTNYTFPSKKLAGKTRDVLYDDLYFGEELTLGKDGAVITKNIPLDPQGFDWNEFTKQDQKLMKFHGKRDTLFQTIATYTLFIGLPIAVAGYLVTPAPYNTIIVGIYALLFILRMFGLKPKSHGSLTDMEGNPLSYAIVRVHDVNQGGKEIFHRVADAQGRYYCLVQKGQYTITVEKKNPDESYSLVYTSPVIDAKKGVVNQNVRAAL